MVLSTFADGIIYQDDLYNRFSISASILQLTLRSAVGYIENKLFLRELRRLTIDRELANYYHNKLLKPSSYCACFSCKIFFLLFFFSLFAFFLLSLSPETYSIFDDNSHRDYLKSLLFHHWSFKIMYHQILKCSTNTGIRAHFPSLTHITRRTRAALRASRFSRKHNQWPPFSLHCNRRTIS